ncbi:MAG: hypothetical protein ACREDF_01440 [Thermoplasmata archaeon]
MFDPDTVKRALEEIERLNVNLENLHRDAGDVKEIGQDIRTLISVVKDMKDRVKAIPVVARQLAIFNQILLQTKHMAGTSGMIQSIIDGILNVARSKRA